MGRQLNLLYAGTLPPHPGGSAILAAELLTRFAQRGHRVRALGPITADSRDAGERFAGRHPEIEITRFDVAYFESAPNEPASEQYRQLESDQVRCRIEHLVAAERPDVIISGRETFALHVPATARRLGVPTLQLIQGATTAGIVQGTLPPSTVRGLLAGFRLADGLVVVARHLVEVYRVLGFDNVRAIQNSVDLQRFTPCPKSASLLQSLGIASGDIVIAHASNMKALKRVMDVSAVAERLLQEHIDFTCLVIGDGPLRRPLEDACRQKGLSSKFRFVGWVEHADMPAYLNLADVVLMPSEAEALALLYLETMACGRVLLASDIAAAREILTDGRDGVLFRASDVGDLAEKTVAVATNAPLRRRLGANARRTAEGYDVEAAVDAYLFFLDEILTRREKATEQIS